MDGCVLALPIDLESLGGLDRPLGHYWGQLDNILGHQVAPQNYGKTTIALDHVLGVNTGTIMVRGREKVVVQLL